MFRLMNILTMSGFLFCVNGVNSDKLSGCSESLGVENRNKITDGQMTASSKKSVKFAAFFGRLNNPGNEKSNMGSWCPRTVNDRQWLQVDFNETRTVTAVTIQGGSNDNYLYATSYALLYSYDGRAWFNYTIDMKVHIFPGQKGIEAKKTYIRSPITARFIKINPRTWSGTGLGFCLRVEFYGCTPKEDCFTPVGMEDGRIRDHQISGSSTYGYHYPSRGRLNNKTKKDSKTQNKTRWGAWCSDMNDQNQYLQVDLLRKRNISAVATQGYILNMFVQKYRLNYSIDGKSWMPCKNEHGNIEFDGNKDNETIQKNSLQLKVTAKYIRFNPMKWNANGYICMRVEVYECLPVKGSVPSVHKRLPRFSDVDNDGGINLTCIMKGQVGIRIDWFKRNTIVQNTNTTRLKATVIGDNGMQSTLSLSNIEITDNGIKYECRGSYPGVNSLFASTTTVLRVGADQPPLSLYSQTTNSLVLYVPYRKFKLAKQFWFEYKPKDSTEKQWKEIYFPPSEKDLYTINHLKPWTLYEVRVTPIHENNNGRTSVLKCWKTAQGVPSAPRNIKIIQINEYNVTIQWEPPKEEEVRGIIKQYIIRYDLTDKTNIDEKPLEVDVPHCTNYTVVSLLPNTRYKFQICAETEGGKGPFNIFHFFTTLKEIKTTPTQKPPKEKLNLKKLNEINITRENVIIVAAEVKNLTSKTDKLNAKDVALTAEILKKIVETNNKESKVGDNILKTISQLLDIESDVLLESNRKHNTSSKFVKILEEYTENGGQFSMNTSNIIVRVDRFWKSLTRAVNKQFDNNTSIMIPKEVMEDAENKTMFFIYYKNGKLFEPKHLVKEICVNGFTENVYQISTPVLSSSIAGKSVKNLSQRVIIRFTVADPKAVKTSSSCVYWDFDGAGGAGYWSTQGCRRQRVYNNTIECACDHMTNFAALLDVYAATSRACGVHSDALTMISYVGCVLSITGLSLTIFTYLFFRRLRKELAAKILIQLCIALLCVLLVFIIGIERARVGPIGCYIVAVLLHYFVLAAFLWMLIEAHFMYLAFVRVWTQHGDHELLKCSFIAWGLPAIVVGVTMSVNLDNYGGYHYCRIEKIPFYAAFFAPVLCIVFINLIVFALILYKLNTRPDSSIGRDKNARYKRMKQAVGIMILVGITWSFGALAVSKARLTFHYLFAIFNSIQGFAIFSFYCLSQKNVRDSWKALLTCNLNKLQKDKSFYTNTYDRRRCSTASTTHNNTLSLARKKASTSSGNTAYPSHSMDTLNRDFTSFNCSSGTLHLENKPSNLNNVVSKNCNVKDGNNDNSPEIWKRRSNLQGDDDPETVGSLNDNLSLTIANSFETFYSDDGTAKSGSYDLVANSNNDSLLSLNSIDLDPNQSLDRQGCYSFVNSQNSLGSSCKDSLGNSIHSEDVNLSTPGTPVQKRPRPSTLIRKKQTILLPSLEKPKSDTVNQNHSSDPLGLRDDFGKLIVSPYRRSVRGVIGVVETSVDTYDEDSPNMVTPQGVRLTQEFNDKQNDKFDPDECIASPTYFAENRRVSGSKDRNSSTNESSIGDICL